MKLSNRVSRYTVISLVTLDILAAIFIAVAVNRGYIHIHASSPDTQAKSSSTHVEFTFKSTELPIWIATLGSPTSPMFGKSLTLSKSDHSCGVSILHKTGKLDINAELQRQQHLATYTMTPTKVQTLTMNTATGPRKYKLHLYTDTHTEALLSKVGGEEHGYIPLDSGYLEISGTCKKANQLSSTIPALQAVKFNK